MELERVQHEQGRQLAARAEWGVESDDGVGWQFKLVGVHLQFRTAGKVRRREGCSHSLLLPLLLLLTSNQFFQRKWELEARLATGGGWMS